MIFTVYILECADHSLYVGHTDNFDLRMKGPRRRFDSAR